MRPVCASASPPIRARSPTRRSRSGAARRWRQLFTAAAAADPAAVSAASERIGIPGTDLSVRTRRDRREARHRIAERFLKHPRSPTGRRTRRPPPEPGGAPTLVFCPGLINTMLPVRAFAAAFPALAAAGWKVLAADAHPMRSCAANVADLVAAVERGEGYGPDYAADRARRGRAARRRDPRRLLEGHRRRADDAGRAPGPRGPREGALLLGRSGRRLVPRRRHLRRDQGRRASRSASSATRSRRRCGRSSRSSASRASPSASTSTT